VERRALVDVRQYREGGGGKPASPLCLPRLLARLVRRSGAKMASLRRKTLFKGLHYAYEVTRYLDWRKHCG
jgi:hypothetical protein